MSIDLKKISENINTALDAMAITPLDGMNLERVDARQLMVTDENIDEHVSIQPTAITFYCACVKAAQRDLERIKIEYDVWKKERYAATKAQLLSSGSKATLADIEAQSEIQNKADNEKWLDQLAEKQEIFDNLDSLYKGWQQKSHTLRDHARLKMDEYNTMGSIPGGPVTPYNMERSKANVRQIIGSQKEGSE